MVNNEDKKDLGVSNDSQSSKQPQDIHSPFFQHQKNSPILRRKPNTPPTIPTTTSPTCKYPKCNIGDTVKVYIRIHEGCKSRTQVFEGTIIKKKRSGISENFTVRRIAHGVGIEREFSVNSPSVVKVEKVRSASIRKAKLSYLRRRRSEQLKLKQKKIELSIR